jgi:hypothetical protein
MSLVAEIAKISKSILEREPVPVWIEALATAWQISLEDRMGN